jgi:SNF2 family DNA or RNA helicase
VFVIHAIWDHHADGGKLHFWAESSQLPLALPASAGRKARDRQSQGQQKQQKQQKPPRHPFALQYEPLRQALGELVGRLHIAAGEASSLELRLPSTGKGPLPSPELILEEEGELQPVAFASYEVPVLALSAEAGFDALLALPDHPPHGVAFGAALRFWVTAARLAYELIARQSYMPSLEESRQDGEAMLRAVWTAVLAPEDAERERQLALMMPPLCWSWLPPGERRTTLPQAMLHHFLNACIDAFVRGSLVSTGLLSSTIPRRRAATYTLPERWLRGLASDDPRLTVSEKEREQFVTAMQTWLGQLRPRGQEAPFRTCFRLDPPSEEDGHDATWHVNYFLQANDDPSLLVPAEMVWRERSSTLTFLKRSFENPQERLLADLGRASRLFPAIEESLREARPHGLKLGTEQAYAFLRESAPLLEQSGFGVLVPPWWQKASARLGVKLKMKAKGAVVSSGLMGLDSIVDYDWTVAVGETTLSAEEFENLVRLKVPLVKVRGQWVELRPEEIEKAIAFLKKKHGGNGQMRLGEALRTGLGREESELGLPVVDVEGEGWIGELLQKLSDGAKIELIDPPAAFQGKLRPYQVRGTSWLAFLRRYGLGGCLADDMGLGKCLCACSLVTVNGFLRKAEEIWARYAGEAIFDGEGFWAEPIEQLLINSIDEASGKIVQARIKRLYRQHVSERLRKIRLEDGSSVTITYPHKLLTDKGWTNDLHVGDYVCVPARLIWNGEPEDPDLVKFLAWQIAEGYENRTASSLTITQKDTALLGELRSCLMRFGEKHGIKVNSPSIVIPQNRAAYLAVTSVAYRRFLEKKNYTWGKLSNEKRIPDFIMQADLDTIRIFLRNFFEAEAAVTESMRSVEISTASPMLIRQLSTLLRRFGIWMRISTKQKRATNGSGIYRPYWFGILGGNAARIFCREIGFAGERKQQKLEKICAKISNTNVEGIPASEIMAGIVATTGLPIRHFGMKTVYVTGTQQFSLASLKQVIAGFDAILSGETELAYRQKPASKWTVQTLNAYAQLDMLLMATTRAHLQWLIDQEVYYCKIREIEDVQYDGWVYDFEVEDHHNFVADGILCHNTIQLITLLLHDREVGKPEDMAQRNPALLICPMSIVGNWHRELQRFAPSLKVMIHHGHERLAGEAFAAEAMQNDVVITTYALALRDREHLAPIEWEYAVVDEAQNIKNEAAKQSQAIKALNARHKIALTGTPVENRLSELWSIMEFVNPGYLGPATEFRQQYAIPIERYHEAERAERLKRVIQPFVLRRLKTDKSIIADLPDKMEMRVYCNLTREQATLYEAVVKEMMEKIEESEGMERRGLVLATLMKLKQICNHPAQFVGDGSALPGRSGKLARLEEMLEEVLAAGDKALIFSQFAEMGGLLRRHLQERLDCEVLFLHGGTPKKLRDSMVQRFQEPHQPVTRSASSPPIFILSLKAGGVGLNLTAANHVFHFDRWWNPAVENQATDRAFRIGQRKNVQVHKFVCVGTLEERIDQMIEQKKELAESIVGSGEAWLTEMSNAELKELFALSREAVAE